MLNDVAAWWNKLKVMIVIINQIIAYFVVHFLEILLVLHRLLVSSIIAYYSVRAKADNVTPM